MVVTTAGDTSLKNPSRGWVFTSYANEAPKWDAICTKYLIFQREICPTSGREHWQGYLELHKASRMPGVQKLIGDMKAHCEPRKGTPQQARDYCKKERTHIEGTQMEYGKLAEKRGERTDLEEAANRIRDGARMREIAEEFPSLYIRHNRGMTALRTILRTTRHEMTELHIVWGTSGSGKTRSVFEKEPDLYIKPAGQWWDGYDGQEAVLIDDVKWNDDYLNSTEFLRLIDRYPMKIPIKGDFIEFTAKRVYITSMYDPSGFIKQDGVSRRLTSVSKLTLQT